MFRPMLAPQEDPLRFPDFFRKLQYPLLCSPKIDGIRGVVKSKNLLSRTGKLIPSYQAQTEFVEIDHLDGELIIGNPTDPGVYNRTQSHVMSYDKPGDLHFHVFDYTHPDWLDKPFWERFDELKRIVSKNNLSNIHIVPHMYEANSEEELVEIENVYLEKGYEGIMMRSPIGRYKNGRATFREGIIYKLKRFIDAEAKIISLIEQNINNNPQETNELGYSKRSSSKGNLTPGDTLGAFVVEYQGQELIVGPGQFDHEKRKQIWDDPSLVLGKELKFRFFAYGVKDKPRQPRAIDIRDPIDL
jgi:DNA ligase-1